ncbi:hypothetical protein Ccrd_016946 [Cynara cardunculus var. scolymus]|uniref:Uncharacterized protein n=1 Tax=Cynara cardunculus var. scolymus TaxID=59895 RepID=A0A103Y913_CYNCS|nr:hypothetical protein Ccrd_016946 [Cynara cardunculus var. scolymus]
MYCQIFNMIPQDLVPFKHHASRLKRVDN